MGLFDPHWGGLKVGNGGSGMLFHADLVPQLLTYLLTRRGSDNVDVSMWRFLHSGQYSDYLAKATWSAHRGLTSSLRMGGQSWKRVECGNALDFYWGHYKECAADRIAEAAVGVGGGGGPVNVTGDPGVRDVLDAWRCSVWSVGTCEQCDYTPA